MRLYLESFCLPLHSGFEDTSDSSCQQPDSKAMILLAVRPGLWFKVLPILGVYPNQDGNLGFRSIELRLGPSRQDRTAERRFSFVPI
jgi:hypothetical protein